uniref:ribosomal protein L23 n=1 Tax=Rhodella violacea TaxID=2801 RepID=UPI001FCCC347|nr:ribosomal protein L23 [Rhodella violacea]UNJ18041.1 ribosomal protein L23 [Rhodella violacea]
MFNVSDRDLLDIIKYPIITDKATRLLEMNQYSFFVNLKATKKAVIKEAIEKAFNVKVTSVNTYRAVRKKRRISRFSGYRSQYKKAIVTLSQGVRFVYNILSQD